MLRALVLAFSFALVVGACKINGEPIGGAPELVLRAYDVPSAHAQEIRNIVSSLMYRGDNQPRLGNVVVAPNGQMLVSAPVAFHDGIAQLTSSMKDMPTQTPAAIAIDYWIVKGVPGETKVGDDVPEAARKALDQMGGGMALSLWDHTRITSMANERANMERKGNQINQTASVQGDDVVTDVEITSDLGHLKMRTALKIDKATVLIQAAAPEGMAGGAVFYVVRAALAQ